MQLPVRFGYFPTEGGLFFFDGLRQVRIKTPSLRLSKKRRQVVLAIVMICSVVMMDCHVCSPFIALEVNGQRVNLRPKSKVMSSLRIHARHFKVGDDALAVFEDIAAKHRCVPVGWRCPLS